MIVKRRKKKRSGIFTRRKKPSPELVQALERADWLLQQKRHEEVIALLKPFAAEHPHAPDLYIDLGVSYADVGHLIKAIDALETAVSQRKNGEVLGMLGALYALGGYPALSLDAYRRAVKLGVDPDEFPSMQSEMAIFSEELREGARVWGKSTKAFAEGVRIMERAQLAFDRDDYAESIRLYQKARRYLGDYPPVDNNLSLTYFFMGEPERAIELAREVQTRDPKNIQALSNLVRFLAWTGRKDEAARVWEQLRPIEPFDPATRVKKAEAAAIMEEDEMVYQLVDTFVAGTSEATVLSERARFFRAVAAANTGRVEQAQEDFKRFGEGDLISEYLDALKAGLPGTGLADRFSYFTFGDMMPVAEVKSIFELLDREDEMPPHEFRRRLDDYLRRFPQILLMGKKLLWEFNDSEAGIDFLATLATPEAYAILRDFALGKKGDEQVRMRALQKLVFAGEIDQNESISFWRKGEWTTVGVHLQAINPDREWRYDPPEVMELLEQGLIAFRENRLDEAEESFEKILALNPEVREAYNNLGAIYAQQGRDNLAREMFEKCIAIDPLYVFPRSNLVNFLLDEGKIDEAIAMIKPVMNLPEYHPLEMVSFLVAQANIQTALGEFDSAEQMLESAREIDPDSPIIEAAMERLLLEREEQHLPQFYDWWRERARAYRDRQRKIPTPNPTLAESLSIYTKDLLTAIARHVAPEGGWSKYRKAELLDFLVRRLQDAEVQSRVLASLPREALEAFRQVQSLGGVMSWDAFEQAFGNDLDESPYWQYHEPQTAMGILRSYGLLVEAEANDELFLSIPVELR